MYGRTIKENAQIEIAALGDRAMKVKMSILRNRMIRSRDTDYRLYMVAVLRFLNRAA